jgi:hypothetical protein
MDEQAKPSASAKDRWAFLDRPAERLRYAVIASLITSHAERGPIVEIGADRGYLLGLLDPERTTGYVAVDLDASALAGVRHDVIAVTREPTRMEDYVPDAGPIAVLVASEVLSYVDAPGPHLLRIWRAAGHIGLALFSSVRPVPEKPNWQRGYDRVQQAIGATGWPELDRVTVASASARLSWEVVALRPGRAG